MFQVIMSLSDSIDELQVTEVAMEEKNSRVIMSTHLTRIVRSVQEELEGKAQENDLFVALMYTLMSEIGFTSTDMQDLSYNHDYNAKKLRALSCMPPNWRNAAGTTYTMNFLLYPWRTACQIIGDAGVLGTLVINAVLTLPDASVVQRCVCIQPAEHVDADHTDISMTYRKLADTSIWFKDLMSPMRSEVLESYGLLNPSLTGIPLEMKFNICTYLSVIDGWKPLSESCIGFQDLTKDQKLWKTYVTRDYGRSTQAASSQEVDDWKSEYQKRHNHMLARRKVLESIHRPSEWLGELLAHDYEYHEFDLSPNPSFVDEWYN